VRSIIVFIFFTLIFSTKLKAQFLMDMLDTTSTTGKSLLAISKNFDYLKIGGYIQPQFQVAESKGASSFEGTDFAPRVSNRFMLRRSRVRIDYLHQENTKQLGVQIVFQFDANERSFTVRDVWGRVFENKWKHFSLTTGMFARPFGFETNLSSSDRESPERGRLNQAFMRSERDLGAMLTFDDRTKKHFLKNIKIDAGLFNGQGINATGDFDNSKDFIGRVALKPIEIRKKIRLTAGASILIGGLENNTKYIYSTTNVAGLKQVIVDSATENVGTKAPRQYYGIDAQLKIKNKVGFTELRGEFIAGKQTGTINSTETPNSLLTNNLEGYHIRNFNGAYFYLLQNIFSTKHQLIVKLDWLDPNTKVKGNEIGAPGSNFTAANIKYTTLGFGYLNYLNDNVKLTLYYAKVWNEKTALTGFTNDLKDNVLTCRLQFRF
jgi:hypothetical protein